ncbi:MAG TPA: dihydrofolate reductase family protein [Actinomycetota bacterium]|nr:dihydrofolate reductase family protein [Actinomycetota bacterium]
MRKLKVTTFLTLDGVMQAPGGPEEDPESGFDQGGWSVGYWDDQVDHEMSDFMGTPFDLVLGRKTYEIFASFWPNATEEQGAKPMNDATKNVASRTLKSLEWANSVVIEGDVVEGVRALKQSDGPELQIHGSSNLIQSFLPHNVIDEFHLLIFPVVLGKGKRLFDEGAMPDGLELVDHKVSSSGVIIATYRTGREIKSGTFGLDQ